VDGNREENPEQKILDYLNTGTFAFFGLTVMPGPQLKQAIPISKKAKALFPDLTIIWGGYFASNQPETVLHSGFVDFIINGMGDVAFPQLLDLIVKEGKHFYEKIPAHQVPHNLIYKQQQELVFTAKDGIYNIDELPDFPYEKLHQQYDIPKYLGKDFSGLKISDLKVFANVKTLRDIDIVGQFSGVVGIFDSYIQFLQQGGYIPTIIHGCTSITIPEAYIYLDSGQLKGILEGLSGAAWYSKLLKDTFQKREPDQALLANTALGFSQMLVLILIALGNLNMMFKRREG
jgi:hypothetical protein